LGHIDEGCPSIFTYDSLYQLAISISTKVLP
jgi:hypothetical protein